MKEKYQKIREIIENSKVGMMATNLGKKPYNVFPIGIQQMDQNGDLWFFSSKTSDLFEDIQKNSRVQIIYSNEEKQEYLSVLGDAVPLMLANKVHELWNPMLSAWFEGKTDPNLILLNIKIEQAKYWNSKTNQMVSLINIPEIMA